VLRPIRTRWIKLVHRGLLRAMSQPTELPMAPEGCTLDDRRFDEQLDRYRRLDSTAISIEDGDAGLVIVFGAGVDLNLLDETVAVERGCCSFFTLDYDASTRRLSIGIDDPARADALAALASALRGPTPPSAR
jgi:hypothetical protein